MPWLRPIVGVSLCSRRAASAPRATHRRPRSECRSRAAAAPPGGVDHIGRRQALMEKRASGPMISATLVRNAMTSCFVSRSISSIRSTSKSASPAFSQIALRGRLGDDAEFGHGVAGVGLDLEPDPEARLRRPDRGHLGAGVAGDHDGFRRLPSLRAERSNPDLAAHLRLGLDCFAVARNDDYRVYSSGALRSRPHCQGRAVPRKRTCLTLSRRTACGQQTSSSSARASSASRPRCNCKRAGDRSPSSIAWARSQARPASAIPASCRPRQSFPTRFPARPARS